MFSDRRGYTLMEVMAALAITVAVSILITVSYRSFQSRIVLNSASEEVESVLREAQSASMSVRDNQEHGVFFDVAAEEYVFFAGSAYTPGAPGNVVHELPSGVVFTTLTIADDVDYVLFQKLTGSTDQTGTVELQTSGSSRVVTYQVVISSAGRISLQEVSS